MTDSKSLLSAFIKNLKSSAIPLVSLLVAGAIVATPLQLHFSLSRYQHYGLGIFVWGLGHIIQAVWNWRTARLWARFGGVFGGLYLTSLGMVFYANPWLDPRVAVQTGQQEDVRALIAYVYTGLTVPLILLWIESIIESTNPKGKPAKGGEPNAQSGSQQKPGKN